MGGFPGPDPEPALAKYVGTGGVLSRIDGSRRFASPAFRNIGDVIVSEPEIILNQTSRELAARAHVSEATVVRFCQWLGFTGLPELKAALAVDLLMPYSTYERVVPGDDANTVISKYYQVSVHSLQKTITLLDVNELQATVAALNNARRVECYGVGGLSGPLAAIMAYRLMNLQIPTTAVQDTHLLISSASLLTEHDVAFGISFSGIARPVCDALAAAHSKGATTIALTNYLNAPITEHADHVLFTAALRDAPIWGEAVSSRLVQLGVMEIIYTCLAIERLPKERVVNHDRCE